MLSQLLATIESRLALHAEDNAASLDEAHAAFFHFIHLLESGQVRSASPDPDNPDIWHCDLRIKKLILCGFRLGHLIESQSHEFQFCDKHNLWPNAQKLVEKKVRIVPGGTTVRPGACLCAGVTIMPPAYVNIGAYIGNGTMIDSHALVGSCAQIGSGCHISAAAQIGGVLEPVGALPVIVEDNCFVGGNCGIYESTHVHKGAVLAAGTILTRSTPLYDLVNETVIQPVEGILHVPAKAVVVPGNRGLNSAFAKKHGLSAYAPLIIKYRDDKTDASVALEQALR